MSRRKYSEKHFISGKLDSKVTDITKQSIHGHNISTKCILFDILNELEKFCYHLRDQLKVCSLWDWCDWRTQAENVIVE